MSLPSPPFLALLLSEAFWICSLLFGTTPLVKLIVLGFAIQKLLLRCPYVSRHRTFLLARFWYRHNDRNRDRPRSPIACSGAELPLKFLAATLKSENVFYALGWQLEECGPCYGHKPKDLLFLRSHNCQFWRQSASRNVYSLQGIASAPSRAPNQSAAATLGDADVDMKDPNREKRRAYGTLKLDISADSPARLVPATKTR